MFKNIGKKIQLISLAFAFLLFAAFIGFGVACLIAGLEEGVEEALKTAGIQAAIICFVLAILSPLLSFVLYGFGTLIIAAEKQAEDTREIKDTLRQALSDGLLSDEIARKLGQVQSKLLANLPAAAPQQPATNAPVQRFVEEPVQQAAPAERPEAPAAAVEEPVEEATAPVAKESDAPVAESPEEATAPAAPAPRPAAPAPRPIKLARPISTATPLRPVGADDEVF